MKYTTLIKTFCVAQIEQNNLCNIIAPLAKSIEPTPDVCVGRNDYILYGRNCKFTKRNNKKKV